MTTREQNRRYYLAHRERLIKEACEYQKAHPRATRVKNKRWEQKDRKLNPGRWKSIEFRKEVKRYGVTENWFNEKLAEQNYKCAICGAEKNGKRRMCIDHDHSTDEARGLLCSPCNTALGFLEKFISEGMFVGAISGWTAIAISYLKQYASTRSPGVHL